MKKMKSRKAIQALKLLTFDPDKDVRNIQKELYLLKKLKEI